MKRQRQRAERVTEKEELERQLYRVELEKRMGKQKVCKDRLGARKDCLSVRQQQRDRHGKTLGKVERVREREKKRER